VEKAQEIIEDQIGKSLADSILKSFAGSHLGDVMVVGGGVSGVQASLDLATAVLRFTWSTRHLPLAATWPSLTRPFPPMTAPSEYSRPNWSRSAGIQYRGPDLH